MSEMHCKRCDDVTEPPGHSVPLLAMVLLCILGGGTPFARTGYCASCAGFANLVTVLVCAVAVVAAVIVSVALS
jgi:hypothetical protein